MGRITACAAIVIAMVAFALYGYNYSGTCARRIYLAADEITQAVDKNDTAKAIEKADLAEQLWRKMSQHTIFVEDTECDNEIAMSLARIKYLPKTARTIFIPNVPCLNALSSCILPVSR